MVVFGKARSVPPCNSFEIRKNKPESESKRERERTSVYGFVRNRT
jgi:hypothetical protein